MASHFADRRVLKTKKAQNDGEQSILFLTTCHPIGSRPYNLKHFLRPLKSTQVRRDGWEQALTKSKSEVLLQGRWSGSNVVNFSLFLLSLTQANTLNSHVTRYFSLRFS